MRGCLAMSGRPDALNQERCSDNKETNTGYDGIVRENAATNQYTAKNDKQDHNHCRRPVPNAKDSRQRGARQ